MPALDVAGEFETIERLLRPLAHPEWARGLMDDVAVVPSRPGFDLVMTKDAMVEGVHFLAGEAPDLIARKLLLVVDCGDGTFAQFAPALALRRLLRHLAERGRITGLRGGQHAIQKGHRIVFQRRQ